MIEQYEIAAVLAEAGLDPQSLAAAGASGAQCDRIFDAGLTYCIGEDRIPQFQNAHKALNQAKAKAVNPSAHVDGQPVTVAQAKIALENLQNAAFQFVTSGLDRDQVATLTKIKSNRHWGLPVKYLVADRTNQEWLALSGALASKRAAAIRGVALAQSVASVISSADSNDAVSQAATRLNTNLDGVSTSWHTHAPASHHQDGPP
jgi:hypothetical protein